MTFWLIVSAMIIVALAIVLPPILRGARASAPARQELAVELHRARLAELEVDLQLGRIDHAQLEEARAELSRQLLDEVGSKQEAAVPQRNMQAKLTAVVVSLVLPTLAGALYWRLGSIDQVLAPPPSPAAQVTPKEIEHMVERLAQRLKEKPNDATGWSMLGRSYVMMRRFSDAEQAFDRAHKLAGDDPALLVDYAEAIALANGDSLAGRPTELLERALRQSFNHPKGLWLAGHAAAQRGDAAQAIKFWQLLSAQLAEGTPAKQTVEQLIQQAKAAPNQLPGAQAPKPAAGGIEVGVRVRVSVAKDLAKKITPDETVFVFARAESGPPMPIAVLRRPAKDLPFTVVLDDNASLMPNRRLSQFERVVVGARVSKTGNAMPQAGDYQGPTQIVSVRNKAEASINISEVVR